MANEASTDPPNDKPLAAKLGLKPGQHLRLVGAPPSWSPGLLPPGVSVTRRRGAHPAEVTVAFFTTQTALEGGLPSIVAALSPRGSLWLCWPRRAGGHRSDLGDRSVRDLALSRGLVDVKVAALDDDWSGLKFLWRQRD